MNIVGEKVLNNKNDEGTVIEQKEGYVFVDFAGVKTKFQYPMAFKQFLRLKNSDIAGLVTREIVAMEDEEKRKIDDLLAIEKEEERKRKKAELEEELRKKEAEREIIKQKLNPKKPGNLTRNKSTKDPKYNNVAFKCNYCDGGKTKDQIGFAGVCSDSAISNNVFIEKRTWCSSEDSYCFQYANGEISRKDLESYMSKKSDYVCYESQMLTNWAAYAGIVQNGERKGEPMKLNEVKINSLCVLTTRNPLTIEAERYIFGAFLVDDTYEGDSAEAGSVSTKSKYKIKLSEDEANTLKYWNYHSNSNSPEKQLWASGLHRYFSNQEAAQILRDIAKVKKGTKDENLAQEFYEHFCKLHNVKIDTLPSPKGSLMH
jgi:hypothetical protein